MDRSERVASQFEAEAARRIKKQRTHPRSPDFRPVYHTGFMRVIEVDGERIAMPCDETGMIISDLNREEK